jgi:phosphotransferase system enzyme I (PtsI)
MTTITGIGVSPGVVLGEVFTISHQVIDHEVPATPREVIAALTSVATDLERRAQAADLDVARDVLQAQSMIAQDPALEEAIASRLPDDIKYPDVRAAIHDAFSGFRNALESLGGYFAERVHDLDEIANRTIAVLSGEVAEAIVLDRPSIIVAEDLTPADTAALDLRYAMALVVKKGGPTSHTAIVARGLGIPAVVGCAAADSLNDGDKVMVDGRMGIVEINPSEANYLHHKTREDALRARAAAVTGPGRLSDSTPINLLANAGSVADSVTAANAGAEGIGLFRTELLFLSRETEPTVEEQVALYSDVFTAQAGNKVVVRTLDAGSDKPVPFLNTVVEENPALGVRGWRLTRNGTGVMKRQLEALAIAAQKTNTDLWVMAPMIDTVAEAADFAAQARGVGIRHVGVMIETPAAAILADKVLAEVDFGSLGTNDLTQYVMAADRLDARLSDLTDSWHPAVLRAISFAANSATALARPLGVCGEAAADPYLAAVLVGLGVTSLSMAPVALSEVRGFLASVDRATCIEVSQLAIGASSAEEAKAIVRARLDELTK